MFGVNQRFGKFCSCHLRGGYVVRRVLEAKCRADGEGCGRFDKAYRLRGREGCSPLEEERSRGADKGNFGGHIVMRVHEPTFECRSFHFHLSLCFSQMRGREDVTLVTPDALRGHHNLAAGKLQSG
jgi:hypothetical protein